MNRFTRRRHLLCVLLMALLGLVPGCDPYNLVWFGLGALVSSQFRTTTVEYRCYRDGIEVDCSTLPTFVGSTNTQ
jgi:hypothetical protein